jgi:tRNA-2-methylthio-N6-dimethylallyladenosine synthase
MTTTLTQKKVYIETYGCQMNAYDTELVKSILSKENMEIITTESQADIVMLNTCSVRDNANRKVYGRIHEIKNRRKHNPVLVGVLGCMATNFKKELLDNPHLKIDFIAGPDSYKQLPQLISEVLETGTKSFDVTLSEFETYSDVLPTRKEGVNAWLAIMRGCNNFCTFCVVPYTRGRERSRDPLNIVDEVKLLVAQGYSQVTLLGQNVNSYRHEKYDFTDVMKMVSDVHGIRRIRFTSPHPKDFPKKLLHVMAERDNICKQIHMPLQAGNTRVLDKMNRTYTKEEFLDLVAEARDILPGVNMSTDIIVGFPTETAEEFEDTMDVVRRVGFDSAFTFKYSPRPNTYAYKKLEDDVSEDEKTRRIMALNDLQRHISLEKNSEHIGTVQEILIEECSSKKSPDDFQGRNDANLIVIVPKGPYEQGDYVKVKITDATVNVLKGQCML